MYLCPKKHAKENMSLCTYVLNTLPGKYVFMYLCPKNTPRKICPYVLLSKTRSNGNMS